MKVRIHAKTSHKDSEHGAFYLELLTHYAPTGQMIMHFICEGTFREHKVHENLIIMWIDVYSPDEMDQETWSTMYHDLMVHDGYHAEVIN